MSLSVRPSVIYLLAAVSLPVFFITGFISMPGQPDIESHEKDGILDIQSLMQKVLHLNQQKKHQEAVDLLMAAMEKKQDDSLLRTLLVQTFELFLEDEIRFGQQDIQADRHNVSAYARVASALELMGDNFRAMEILVNGVSLNPKAPELWMKVGKLEHKAGRSNEALDVFKEVIRLDNKASDAYNNVAYIISQQKIATNDELNLAESYALRARKLNPDNPEYIDTLAEIKFKKGESVLAQSLIKEAIKIDPERNSFKNQLQKFSGPEDYLLSE